jgi:hypothetical protein
MCTVVGNRGRPENGGHIRTREPTQREGKAHGRPHTGVTSISASDLADRAVTAPAHLIIWGGTFNDIQGARRALNRLGSAAEAWQWAAAT